MVEYLDADDIYYDALDADESAGAKYPDHETETDNTDWDADDSEEPEQEAEDEADEHVISHMIIKHESVRIALIRQENGCRTEEDFEKLTATWDRLDGNREQREQRYEKASTDDVKDFEFKEHQTIFPAPLGHTWWRQLLGGNFIDVIHDCPLEIQEFTSSRNIYELVTALKDAQKEVLYYRAIRYWSNQRIAAVRSQTDRNILKTYETLIKSIRYKLYMRLLPRYRAAAPLTIAQKEFMQDNEMKYGDGKPTRTRRTKAEIKKQLTMAKVNDIL